MKQSQLAKVSQFQSKGPNTEKARCYLEKRWLHFCFSSDSDTI